MTSIQLNQPHNEHLELTDEELHYFITESINLIHSKYHNIEDIVICMHTKVLNCLMTSKFGFKISCMNSNFESEYRYKWCDNFPILITTDCIIRVMLDPSDLST